MTYKIAVNKMALPGKLPAGDSRWVQLNDSFVNQELEAIDIANAIYTGHAYAAWHSGRRKDENFVCAQHIAVDMDSHDERSTVDYIASMEFVQIYGGLIHTTPSHTKDDPRARVIFFLDQPIINASGYEAAIRFVYELFPGADKACIDSSRFFYGSLHCDMAWPDNVLPLAHLQSYYRRWRHTLQIPANQPAAQTLPPVGAKLPEGKLTPDVFLDYAIRDASGEGRNNRGYRLARQLKELGLPQFEAEQYMRRYQQYVERTGQHNYTEQEAITSLKSAYARPQAAH